VAKMVTIKVPSLKVTVPLAAAALPADLVPMDGPAGEPVLDLVLEGGSLTVRAKINGKNGSPALLILLANSLQASKPI
jgi:hypothetical protein